MTTFIREATWIAPPFGMNQRHYTEQEKKEFEEGKKNQERVFARAWLLEEAKHNKNGPRVAEIMGEIAVESVAYLNEPPAKLAPVSSATARKVEEK